MDGNFKLAHVKQKRPEDDVWLADGHGMVTEQGRYKEHIVTAVEERDVSTMHNHSNPLGHTFHGLQKCTCSAHRAVLDKQMDHGGCDLTGGGATACPHHGAFAPCSFADFQKGEQ